MTIKEKLIELMEKLKTLKEEQQITLSCLYRFQELISVIMLAYYKESIDNFEYFCKYSLSSINSERIDGFVTLLKNPVINYGIQFKEQKNSISDSEIIRAIKDAKEKHPYIDKTIFVTYETNMVGNNKKVRKLEEEFIKEGTSSILKIRLVDLADIIEKEKADNPTKTRCKNYEVLCKQLDAVEELIDEDCYPEFDEPLKIKYYRQKHD